LAKTNNFRRFIGKEIENDEDEDDDEINEQRIKNEGGNGRSNEELG